MGLTLPCLTVCCCRLQLPPPPSMCLSVAVEDTTARNQGCLGGATNAVKRIPGALVAAPRIEFNFIGPYGRLYENCSLSQANNARVEVNRLVTYYWSKAKKAWVTLQDNTLSAGDYFKANFQQPNP